MKVNLPQERRFMVSEWVHNGWEQAQPPKIQREESRDGRGNLDASDETG